MQNSLERNELKDIFKEAIIELIHERKEELSEIIFEVLEDYFMGKAIEEGLSTKSVTKEDILDALGR
jgi:Holliday junction resolvasome RuvABC ATP-dependent DNA helicase subunit